MKKFTPTYHANNVYEINPNFFKEIGVENIIFDLDNTLTSHKNAVPSVEEVNLINILKGLGYRVFIISNNKAKRVGLYANHIGVEYVSSARKPFKKRFNSFIDKKGLDREKTILLGDQILTDVRVAKKVNIRVVLVEKLVESDQFVTKFTRIIDRIIRKKLKKKGLLSNWMDIYEGKH